MSVLFKTLFIVFSIFIAIYVSWNAAFPSGSWRYRMTVAVETPEGLKIGSAVREVRVQLGWSPLPEMHPNIELSGQAVVVDLGKRGRLFALMRGPKLGEDYGDAIPMEVFPFHGGGYTRKGILYYESLKTEETVVPPNLYPYLVSFKNLQDVTTVEMALDMAKQPGKEGILDPYTISADHMSEIFGDGVRLKSITLTMTDEPVTKLSRDNFPTFEGRYLDWFSHLQYRDPRRIHAADFLKE